MTAMETLLHPLAERIAAMPPGHAAFALVDMAGLAHLPDARAILDLIRKAGALSVLQDERPDALLATPWLLRLADGSTDRLLKQSLGWALRGPGVSWLLSPLASADLARRLRRRAAAELSDSHPVLLRHFDPRVLPELLRVLHEPQRQAFIELGQAWMHLDRTQTLQCIALTPVADLDPFQAPLRLDDHQFKALLSASEIDQLMPEMARADPVAFMGLSVAQRVDLARECLKLSNAWHLESLADKTTVGLLLLKLGVGFHQRAAWLHGIAQLERGRMTLLEVIELATATPARESDGR